MRKILVILGPTSTGKTNLALLLANKFNGELIACDSRQVYSGLDIGTGKDGAKAWMYDIVSLRKQYTVNDYVKEANKAISNIIARNKLPIIVGGTGLYLKALLEGMPNLGAPIDLNLRKKLEKLPLRNLQKKLQELSLGKWEKMNLSDRQNPRRLIRAIEVETLSLRGVKRSRLLSGLIARDDSILKIGLTAPRQILYQRINDKALEWVSEGIVGEVNCLINRGISKKRITNLGLEYRVIIEYLDNKLTKEGMIKKMQDKVRAYARRQITWFKREKNISWFDITDKNFQGELEKNISKWYHSSYASQN